MEFPGWKFLASWVEFLDEVPRWNFAGGGGSCLFPSSWDFWWDFLDGIFLGGISGWQFLAFLCLGEKLARWTYLARNCRKLSFSARLTRVEFCEWKFLNFPLFGCKLLRWSFLGGSSLQCSCSFLEFPFWNLRDLLASLCLQRNVLGGVSWVGHPSWQFLAFLSLGKKLARCTNLAWKCWDLSSSARLTWVGFCVWKFLSFPLSGCKLLRWSFLGGSSLQCSYSFLEFPFLNLRDLLASLLSTEKFSRWSFWVGHRGWQFFPFLCLGENWLDVPTWLEIIAGSFLPLSKTFLVGVLWVEIP